MKRDAEQAPQEILFVHPTTPRSSDTSRARSYSSFYHLIIAPPLFVVNLKNANYGKKIACITGFLGGWALLTKKRG